jgi:hypothetical protein
MTTLFKITLSMWAGAALFGCATQSNSKSPASAPTSRSIPVVKTWGELLRQEPIALRDGARVRLGVEAAQCAVGDAVFVYCFTEGYAVARQNIGGVAHELMQEGVYWGEPMQQGAQFRQLGPVYVSIRRDGRAASPQKVAVIVPQPVLGFESQPYRSRLKLLFALPVVIEQSGRNVVAIRNEKGELLAETTIVGKGNAHTWSPLRFIAGGYSKAGQAPPSFTNPASGVALPNWDGVNPVAVHTRVRGLAKRPPANDEALPKFATADSAPQFKLSVSENQLIVENLDFHQPEIVISAPQRFWLARWWVNGKPVVIPQKISKPFVQQLLHPEQPVPIERATEDFLLESLLFDQFISGKATTGSTVQLALKPNLKALGAKSGDTIGVQLMYCELAWFPTARLPKFTLAELIQNTFVGNRDNLFPTIPEEFITHEARPQIRVTNRVDFVAP